VIIKNIFSPAEEDIDLQGHTFVYPPSKEFRDARDDAADGPWTCDCAHDHDEVTTELREVPPIFHEGDAFHGTVFVSLDGQLVLAHAARHRQA
jgi:hypothetical protein